ncbi:hypothetical protein [Campylobacter majalis]|uniref:hypothetical protein n=1 Tax=Campylobacter majalis TaxID=2790656 RepID=UPI001E289BE1|nr:hypothetical protein [Campylobacter majalis]
MLLIFLLGLYAYLSSDLSKPKERVYQVYALKFDDLPDSEKQKYIPKQIIKIDENLSENIDELKKIISELKITNEALWADNLSLNDKNLDLSIKLDETNEPKIQANLNDDSLKEQELRYMQNIQELQKALSDTQKENLQNVKNYEQKIIKLENELLMLKNEYDKNITATVLQNEIKLNDIMQINNRLNTEISLLNTNLHDSNLTKKELNTLRAQLNNYQQEKENLTHLHKMELKRVEDGYKMQISVLEQELSKKANAVYDNMTEIAALNAKINQINMENLTIKSNKDKSDTELKNAKSEIENLTKLKITNEAQILKNKETIAALNDDLKHKVNLDINKTKQIGELNSKIAALNIDLNNSKNNINSLNEAISIKDSNITAIKAELDIKASELSDAQANVAKLNTDLNKQLEILKTDAKNYEILTAEISRLRNLTNKDDAVKTLQDELSVLKTEIKKKTTEFMAKSELGKKINELEKELELGLDRQDKLEDENINLKQILETQTRPEVPKKVVFVSQIECINIDKDTITTTCKNRVEQFLARYNANYLYEITAIVDGRGYALPYEISSKISKSELDRLNNYVDYGVGTQRASMAAQLIRDEYGDFARISFNQNVIKRANARGFIIKAYR